MKLNKNEMKTIVGGEVQPAVCTITCKVNNTNEVLGEITVSKCNDNDITKCLQHWANTTVAVCSCSGS